MDFQIGSRTDLIRLRWLAMQDPIALDKWPQVIDHIVECTADKVLTKRLLERCEYEEAILKTLEIWYSCGGKRANLKEVLDELKLHSLEEKIAAQFGPTGLPQDNVGQASCVNNGHTYRRQVVSLLILICATLFCVFAVVAFTYFSSNTTSVGSNRSPDTLNSGQITDEKLKFIRELVVSDPTALQRWATTVDYIVTYPVDELRIKSLIKRGESGDFEEAVLISLRIWNAAGEERVNL